MNACQRCRHENVADASFCAMCGQPLEQTEQKQKGLFCAYCDEEAPGDSLYCPTCGRSFNASTTQTTIGIQWLEDGIQAVQQGATFSSKGSAHQLKNTIEVSEDEAITSAQSLSAKEKQAFPPLIDPVALNTPGHIPTLAGTPPSSTVPGVSGTPPLNHVPSIPGSPSLPSSTSASNVSGASSTSSSSPIRMGPRAANGGKQVAHTAVKAGGNAHAAGSLATGIAAKVALVVVVCVIAAGSVVGATRWITAQRQGASTPTLVTRPVPPTLTNCPATGAARLAVLAPLKLGNNDNLVYIDNTRSFGVLKRYDTTSGKTTILAEIHDELIGNARVSPDGQWVLFEATP